MSRTVVVMYPAKKGGAKREEIGIAGTFVPFERTVIETGRPVMRAEVEEGSALHRAVLANATVFTVLSVGTRVAPSEAPRPHFAESELLGRAPEPEPEADKYPLVTAARRNGWAYKDMTGAGENNVWDERGGRGERSGLSMAELAMCVPPPRWLPEGEESPGLCDTHWPWEVPGFVAPGMGWRPPALKLKRRLADDVPRDEAPVSPEPLPLVEPDLPESQPDLTPAPPDADTKAAKPARAPRRVETRTEEVLQDVSDERKEAAIAKILTLWSANNEAPSVNKAQHGLKTSGFDFTKKQTEALLNLATDKARAATSPPP